MPPNFSALSLMNIIILDFHSGPNTNFSELRLPMTQLYSLAHKSEKVCNLNVLLNWDYDVKMYFTGPHSRGRNFHFARSGHLRILELWGGSLLSRDPLQMVQFCIR